MKYKLKYFRVQLYQNCLLAMCVHIAAIPRLPYISHENSWDKINYSFQSTFSTDGTISFDSDNGISVGALQCNTSNRMDDYPAKNALDFFVEANNSIRVFAQNETLKYLLMSFEQKKSFLGAKKLFFGNARIISALANHTKGANVFVNVDSLMAIPDLINIKNLIGLPIMGNIGSLSSKLTEDK